MLHSSEPEKGGAAFSHTVPTPRNQRFASPAKRPAWRRHHNRTEGVIRM